MKKCIMAWVQCSLTTNNPINKLLKSLFVYTYNPIAIDCISNKGTICRRWAPSTIYLPFGGPSGSNPENCMKR